VRSLRTSHTASLRRQNRYSLESSPAGLVEAVHRARGCIKELLNSLHREYSPAGELSRLYLFCLRRLAVCEVRRDRTILEEIRKVIAPLCDAYRQIQDQDTSGPVMNNSQTVYAGLTYGRNQLTENMADQGTNRGMLV
jgi:flagellar protein FliS